MDDLIGFLADRMDEDEQHAQRSSALLLINHADRCSVPDSDEWHTYQHFTRWEPRRVLREVKAKRQLLEASVLLIDRYAGGTILDYAVHTLRLLALSYADHTDYRQEWKP